MELLVSARKGPFGLTLSSTHKQRVLLPVYGV